MSSVQALSHYIQYHNAKNCIVNSLAHNLMLCSKYSVYLIQTGDLSHWKIKTGDWKVVEGGYGTEKAFVTSHMDCIKSQQVDLTKHFSRVYLDTAPDIQVDIF